MLHKIHEYEQIIFRDHGSIVGEQLAIVNINKNPNGIISFIDMDEVFLVNVN